MEIEEDGSQNKHGWQNTPSINLADMLHWRI
jgi:hypothetical protein